MPAKLHPADAAAARIIGRASRFEIALFRGQGRYAKADAATLIEARESRGPAGGRSGQRPNRDDLRHHHRGPLGPRHTRHPASHGDQPDAADLQHQVQRPPRGREGRHAGRSDRGHQDPGRLFLARDAGRQCGSQRPSPPPSRSSPAKTAKVKRDRTPSAPVAPAVAPKPRQRANVEALEASARAGNLPQPPDFSAATHARFRGKLARLADLAAAGDVEALRAFEINPVSSSPKAMARYRDLCVIALQARAGRERAA